MNRVIFKIKAVSIWSLLTIVTVSGLFARGIVYYAHDDVGRGIFWLAAGLAAETVMGWMLGAMASRVSKDFADYIQGDDKNQ
jgi:hypothetical protein